MNRRERGLTARLLLCDVRKKEFCGWRGQRGQKGIRWGFCVLVGKFPSHLYERGRNVCIGGSGWEGSTWQRSTSWKLGIYTRLRRKVFNCQVFSAIPLGGEGMAQRSFVPTAPGLHEAPERSHPFESTTLTFFYFLLLYNFQFN